MLIALTGRKGHGKDTAAAVLGKFDFQYYRFAAPLKRWTTEVIEGIGYTSGEAYKMVEGDRKQEVIPELDITARELMQRIGSFGRTIDESLWITMVLENIERDRSGRAVITDVRYPNECAAIRARGGKVIRIVNPRVLKDEFSDHPSESSIDTLEVDAEIINKGSIPELHLHMFNTVMDWMKR